MPLPLVTCLLVLGCVEAADSTVAGLAVVGIATVIQFFLPTYSATVTQKVPDGVPDEDTYSI